MQCPACSHPEMEEKNQDETLSYKGQTVTVQNLRGEFCPACGEGVWDSESNRRLDEAQTAFLNAVRSEASADIRRIRKSLKLTQAKLAENFGFGFPIIVRSLSLITPSALRSTYLNSPGLANAPVNPAASPSASV